MKRALLVGVDAYDKFDNLQGCVNDVTALHPLLARHEDGTVNFSCETFNTSAGQVTRDGLLAHLKRLLAPGADVALFYFAGHGSGDGDVALVTSDGTRDTLGVTMAEVLGLVEKSPVPEINIVLDCCFSGGAGAVPQLGSMGAFLKPGLSILTASRGDQTSAETPDGRPRLNTVAETADLFNMHPRVAISLHCIPTEICPDAAKIEKSVVVLKEENREGTSVGRRRRGRQWQSPMVRPADR